MKKGKRVMLAILAAALLATGIVALVGCESADRAAAQRANA